MSEPLPAVQTREGVSADLGRLTRLLAPQSVAVIGASDSPGNRGGTAVRFLRKFGYTGAVYPIHPAADTVGGLPAWRSLDALPERPEAAVVGLGATKVLPTLRECAAVGIRDAIVWAGGFAEGGPEGREREAELRAFCQDEDFRIIGPNSLGVVSTQFAFTGTFASWLATEDELLPGYTAVISQSGGLGAAVHSAAQRNGVGLRYMVSTGNEAAVQVADVVAAVAHDPELRVIAMYLEGVRDGDRFVAAVREARAAGKEVVVLKAGRSGASARAAAAHTGALVGGGKVWRSVLREEGAIEVRSIDRLLGVSALIAQHGGRKIRGSRIGLVCFGGGMGVIAADDAADVGLAVPAFSDSLKEQLRPLVPAIASLNNPTDLTPEMFTRDEWREGFGQVLDLVERSGEVDSIAVLCGAMARGSEGIAELTGAYSQRAKTGLTVSWPLAPPAARQILRDHGVFLFDSHAEAIGAVGEATRAFCAPQRGVAPPQESARHADVLRTWAQNVAGSRRLVPEPEVHNLLRQLGIPTLPGRLAASKESAVKAAAEIGFPVALKVASETVTHRAAAGLVRLGVDSPEAVALLYKELAAAAPDAMGVYVQQMASGGAELFVSATRDPTFGVVLAVGAGGVRVEAAGGVEVSRAPLDQATAERLVRDAHLVGVGRGAEQSAALERAAEFVMAFSEAMAAAPWPEFALELNPVFVSNSQVVAADALLVIERDKVEQA